MAIHWFSLKRVLGYGGHCQWGQVPLRLEAACSMNASKKFDVDQDMLTTNNEASFDNFY
jgi:hypothetical protein